MNTKLHLLHLDQQPAVCGRHISYLYRKSSVHFTAKFKELALSPMQSVMLVGIYRHSGVNQQALSQTISVDTGVTSRMLRELEDKGHIEKKRDESNRRNFNLYLTPTGQALVEKSLIVQGAYWDQLLEEFTPEEVQTLNTLLQKMEQRAYDLEK